MADAPRCPVTGRDMVRDTRPRMISFKGRTATFDQPGWYSDAAGETILTGSDNRVWGRELAKLKAAHAGLVGPDGVRRIREGLGLSQRDAGFIIGGGPNAFQKYESGEVLVSHAVSNLLRLLEKHPEQLAELKEQALEPA